MAESLGAVTSILGIMDFGLKLATLLQAYFEAVVGAEERLRDIAFDVNSTASALKQLQGIIDAEKDDGKAQKNPKVFKDEGREEIEVLAVQCGKLYTTIVILVTKAGTSGWKGKMPPGSLDVRTLRASNLSRSLKWPWLEPRIKRCQEQLRWLKVNLMFDLQLASLAQFQIGTPERLPGSFEEELALRSWVERLRLRKIKCTKELVSRLKKADEIDSLLDADTVSIVRSASGIPVGNADSRPELDDNLKDLTQSGSSAKGNVDEPPVIIINGEQTSCPSNRVLEPGSEKNSGGKSLDKSTQSPQSPSSIMTSDTLVQDKEKEKEHEATVEKIIIEDKAPSPALPATTAPQDNLNKKASSTEAVEKVGDGYRASLGDDDKKGEMLSLPVYESRFGALPLWLKDLFGHRDKFFRDWESQTLEAFVVHQDARTLLKLPFGHQRLTFGLKRLMRKNRGLSWDQYMSLDSQHLTEINKAVTYAKELDSRDRTCLAVDIHKEKSGLHAERMLIFFSLGAPVEPVHLTDCVGRKFDFPFERCRTWNGMKRLIDQAFLHVAVLGPHVYACRYDLCMVEQNFIVLPAVWEATIKPGCALAMHMWPPPVLPPPPPMMPPRARGPPPPPPNWSPPPPQKYGSDWSYSDSDDMGELVVDSDIEDEAEDLGIEIDFDKEEEKAELCVSELLGKWTNATDIVGGSLCSDNEFSDSDSGSFVSD